MNDLEQPLNWLVGGGGVGIGFFFCRWLLEWIAGRMDKKADRIDAGTEKLISHLENRIDSMQTRLVVVEQELEDCKKRHNESEAEVMRLKAILQGYGNAREAAALVQAMEKRENTK